MVCSEIPIMAAGAPGKDLRGPHGTRISGRGLNVAETRKGKKKAAENWKTVKKAA